MSNQSSISVAIRKANFKQEYKGHNQIEIAFLLRFMVRFGLEGKLMPLGNKKDYLRFIHPKLKSMPPINLTIYNRMYAIESAYLVNKFLKLEGFNFIITSSPFDKKAMKIIKENKINWVITFTKYQVGEPSKEFRESDLKSLQAILRRAHMQEQPYRDCYNRHGNKGLVWINEARTYHCKHCGRFINTIPTTVNSLYKTIERVFDELVAENRIDKKLSERRGLLKLWSFYFKVNQIIERFENAELRLKNPEINDKEVKQIVKSLYETFKDMFKDEPP